jgi:hypothetical protein
MYIKITNGVPSKYTIGQLRRDNPQTSFPRIIPDSVLADYSVYLCSIVDVDIDPLVQTKVDGDCTQTNNAWSLQRVASNLPQQDAERNVREHRDALLSETDYLALGDTTLSSDMAAYRQALRDVTSQAGFPADVTWPTKP